ncbi:MAG: transglutaminase domain-containing protein [Pseudohongiella sp.]|nr:transglutaminase domain-containing protein [Pseudohongiella sp.]
MSKTISQISSNTSVTSGKRTQGLIRAVILALACWVLSTPLTTVTGSTAAAIGCLLACLWADKQQRTGTLLQLRAPALLLMLALALVLISTVTSLLVQSAVLANLLGAIVLYQSGQSLFWFTLAATVAIALRHTARRHSWGALPELLFVACAFVITLAAHQRGMIDRPYFIGDFALIRGLDPTTILMAIGVAAVLALAILLMMENQHRRLPYHASILGVLCFSLLFYVQFFGLPTPQLTNDLGLTGTQGSGSSANNDSPFRDGENNASDREAPVAIVLFRDDYEPAGGAYYFRESAYSEFNGTLLWTAENPDLDQDLVDRFPSSPIDVSNEVPAQQLRRRVTTTIGLLAPHRSPFGLDAPVRFEPAPNPNSLRFRQTFTVESMVPEFDFPDLVGRKAGSSTWTLQQWAEYLEMPDDPRYGEFARQLTATLRPEFADDPYAKAMAIKAWLDENGIYSLKNEHAYAADPAASFLFGDLTGYCVHFAYSATYLYRSLGIPARVGVGYSVPAANRAGGSALLIQAVNGHAWPEIYLEDLGWVIVDPAPRQTLVDMSVDPQDSLQQLLGDMLRDDAAFQAFLQDQAGASAINWALTLRVLAALAFALLLLAYAIKIYRGSCIAWADERELYRLAYRAALDTLAAHGRVRRTGESREAFARRVSQALPAFQTLSDWHLASAPGYAFDPSLLVAGGPVSASSAAPGLNRQQWLQQVAALRKQLHTRQRWWQNALATAHPLPWLQSS